MRDPIRLLILGTGHMGGGIARLARHKPGLELVGAFARRPTRNGVDLGPAIGLDHDLGVSIATDLDALIAASRPDVAIQATCSTLAEARAEIRTLLAAGVHVISIAEEMAYPACVSTEIADELDRLAKVSGACVLGTGINPGFVLDSLIIALTGVCADITAITATRLNDLAPYGKTVLTSQGIGLTPEAFEQGVREGDVVGHVGFPQSIHMIADAMGWRIDRIEETREPIIAAVRREIDVMTIEPGQVAGCRHTAVAYKDGAPVITLVHPQQVSPDLEGVEAVAHNRKPARRWCSRHNQGRWHPERYRPYGP
ncbi:MAG: hypothetical protein HQ513_17915 [Rhodospirillales bacterium]|nr:hypothetical protein [Rhodospirillales bacterium]